ncbi:MAG: hypothetical protein ACLQGP_22230 [Isosphaeraceae bacterium]
MNTFRDASILVVGYQRPLPDGRAVICGPSYRGGNFHWSSGRTVAVKLLPKRGGAGPLDALTSCADPRMLSWGELTGYDPFSTGLPELRAIQQFSSIMLAPGNRGEHLPGFVVVPAETDVRFVSREMTLNLPGLQSRADRLCQEAREAPDFEEIVLRCEGQGQGFLVLPARALADGLSSITTEVTQILPADGPELASGQIYTLMWCRREKERNAELREIPIGEATSCHLTT